MTALRIRFRLSLRRPLTEREAILAVRAVIRAMTEPRKRKSRWRENREKISAFWEVPHA